jgi:hypothetical protein
MSHVTEMKLRIHDIDALKVAAEACGLEFRENQHTYCWWGQFMNDSHAYGNHDPKKFGQCEHALREPGTVPQDGSSGPWEIGVVKATDGDGYDLLFDTFGGAGQRLTQKVGPRANKFRREYAAAVASKKSLASLARRGFKLSREEMPGNRIRLKLRRG